MTSTRKVNIAVSKKTEKQKNWPKGAIDFEINKKNKKMDGN